MLTRLYSHYSTVIGLINLLRENTLYRQRIHQTLQFSSLLRSYKESSYCQPHMQLYRFLNIEGPQSAFCTMIRIISSSTAPLGTVHQLQKTIEILLRRIYIIAINNINVIPQKLRAVILSFFAIFLRHP